MSITCLLYTSSKLSLKLQAYQYLKTKILNCEYRPNEFLNEQKLCAETVSYTHPHDIAADFLEKMRSIGYTPEKAAALLEHWDTEEVDPHE